MKNVPSYTKKSEKQEREELLGGNEEIDDEGFDLDFGDLLGTNDLVDTERSKRILGKINDSEQMGVQALNELQRQKGFFIFFFYNFIFVFLFFVYLL
jgi:hypothetical protein